MPFPNSRRYIADIDVLSRYHAKRILVSNEKEEDQNKAQTQVQSSDDVLGEGERKRRVSALDASNGTKATPISSINNDENDVTVGISIGGWDIRTATSTIAHEGEMDELTALLQGLANEENDQDVAACSDGDDTSSSRGGEQGGESADGIVTDRRKRRKRRLCLPEIVFLQAHISFKCNDNDIKETLVSLGDDDDKSVMELLHLEFNARDALCEWAQCHAHIEFSPEEEQQQQYEKESRKTHYRGVSIIKSIDAKLWSERQQQQQQQQQQQHWQRQSQANHPSRTTIPTATVATMGTTKPQLSPLGTQFHPVTKRPTPSFSTRSSFSHASARPSSIAPQSKKSNPPQSTLFGPTNIPMPNCSTEFHYDWTFSTPYSGPTNLPNNNCRSDTQLLWKPTKSSGMDLSLLTDQTLPILYYDEIKLYEDDMHDNGYACLGCKLRVMPTCFLLLMSLFVRVDYVLVRVREVRFFVSFDCHDGGADADVDHSGYNGDNGNHNQRKERKRRRVWRDVSWRECKWEDLINTGLPAQVGMWRLEDESLKQQQRVQEMMKRLPKVGLPQDLPEHSFLDVQDFVNGA